MSDMLCGGQARLTPLQSFFRLLPAQLPIQPIQGGRNSCGGFFEQGNFLVLNNVRFAVVGRQCAPDPSLETDRQGRRGSEPSLDCRRMPRGRARVAFKVIDHTHCAIADALASRPLTLWPVAGINLDFIEVVLFTPIARIGTP